MSVKPYAIKRQSGRTILKFAEDCTQDYSFDATEMLLVLDENARHILLDFSECDKFGSAAIQMLESFLVKAKEAGKVAVVHIYNVSEGILNDAELIGVKDLITSFPYIIKGT